MYVKLKRLKEKPNFYLIYCRNNLFSKSISWIKVCFLTYLFYLGKIKKFQNLEIRVMVEMPQITLVIFHKCICEKSYLKMFGNVFKK